MAFNTAVTKAVFDQLMSHAQKLGVFDRVGQHEPVNPPGNGVTCAIVLESIRADPKYSGLASVSGIITFTVRVGQTMELNPAALDGVDPSVLGAVCILLNEYSGAFTLGGNVRAIDLEGLSARTAYINRAGKWERVIDITVPVGLNDMFTEVA